MHGRARLRSYIHAGTHAYIHTACRRRGFCCAHSSPLHTYIHPSIHPSINTCMHTYSMPTSRLLLCAFKPFAYIHTYIHAYIHTYMHAYIQHADIEASAVRIQALSRKKRDQNRTKVCVYVYVCVYIYMHFRLVICGVISGR